MDKDRTEQCWHSYLLLHQMNSSKKLPGDTFKEQFSVGLQFRSHSCPHSNMVLTDSVLITVSSRTAVIIKTN